MSQVEGLSWGGSKDKDGRPVPGERRQGPGGGQRLRMGWQSLQAMRGQVDTTELASSPNLSLILIRH